MRQKIFANDAFAVFATCIKENETARCDMHINEWISSTNDNYIDFGIRIYDAKQVKQLGVFVPFLVKKDEITDLSECMRDEKVMRGVFNANCEITQSSSSPIIKIDNKDDNRKENLLKLEHEDFLIRTVKNGTIIQFRISSFHKVLTEDIAYIRFRLPHKSIGILFTPIPWSFKSLFESPVVKYEYNYNMKINEMRSLPFKVRECLGVSQPKFLKIIVAVATDEQYDVNHSDCYKVRQLEEDLFLPYAPESFPCTHAFVYQWRNTDKRHCVFNFTISQETISLKSLLGYALIVITLSAMGSALWEGISALF